MCYTPLDSARLRDSNGPAYTRIRQFPMALRSIHWRAIIFACLARISVTAEAIFTMPIRLDSPRLELSNAFPNVRNDPTGPLQRPYLLPIAPKHQIFHISTGTYAIFSIPIPFEPHFSHLSNGPVYERERLIVRSECAIYVIWADFSNIGHISITNCVRTMIVALPGSSNHLLSTPLWVLGSVFQIICSFTASSLSFPPPNLAFLHQPLANFCNGYTIRSGLKAPIQRSCWYHGTPSPSSEIPLCPQLSGFLQFPFFSGPGQNLLLFYAFEPPYKLAALATDL